MVHHHKVGADGQLTKKDVVDAFAFSQPCLNIAEKEDLISATGEYVVSDGPHTNGPIAKFEIAIGFSRHYPQDEPIVLETANAIERIADRHMYTNGRCCLGVWEEWLATSADTSIRAFRDGPLKNFFLGQIVFNETGKWPFGERSHGVIGVAEAIGAFLGKLLNTESAEHYIHAVCSETLKGHWRCPCGSGLRLRDCCLEEILALRKKTDRQAADRLRRRLIDVRKIERSL